MFWRIKFGKRSSFSQRNSIGFRLSPLEYSRDEQTFYTQLHCSCDFSDEPQRKRVQLITTISGVSGLVNYYYNFFFVCLFENYRSLTQTQQQLSLNLTRLKGREGELIHYSYRIQLLLSFKTGGKGRPWRRHICTIYLRSSLRKDFC